jgi:hypothetical protein
MGAGSEAISAAPSNATEAIRRPTCDRSTSPINPQPGPYLAPSEFSQPAVTPPSKLPALSQEERGRLVAVLAKKHHLASLHPGVLDRILSLSKMHDLTGMTEEQFGQLAALAKSHESDARDPEEFVRIATLAKRHEGLTPSLLLHNMPFRDYMLERHNTDLGPPPITLSGRKANGVVYAWPEEPSDAIPYVAKIIRPARKASSSGSTVVSSNRSVSGSTAVASNRSVMESSAFEAHTRERRFSLRQWFSGLRSRR